MVIHGHFEKPSLYLPPAIFPKKGDIFRELNISTLKHDESEKRLPEIDGDRPNQFFFNFRKQCKCKKAQG